MKKPPMPLPERRRHPDKSPRDLDLRVPVTPLEKERIIWGADSCRLSIANYLRQLGRGRRPRAAVDRARIHRVLCFNGDIGRFGGLLKLWLSDDAKLNTFNRTQVRRLLTCVQDTSSSVSQLLENLMRPPGPQASQLGNPYIAEASPPPRKHHIHVPVTLAEATAIRDAATDRQQRVAQYLRQKGLGYRARTAVSDELLQALQHDAEGLAAAGHFLKAWITDSPKLGEISTGRTHDDVQHAMRTARRHLVSLRQTATSYQ